MSHCLSIVMHYIEKINQSSKTFVLIHRDDVFVGPFRAPPLGFNVIPIPLGAARVSIQCSTSVCSKVAGCTLQFMHNKTC